MYKETSKLTDFAGFEMPLYYQGIVHEHLTVRNDVGVFDISHMGRVMIAGVDAEPFLNNLITNDVSKLVPNSALYSVMCNHNGGIIDDFVVYRIDTERFLMVYNASNRQKDFNWLIGNSRNFKVTIEDVSDKVAMIAVQGPKAQKALQKMSTEDLSRIERFKCGGTRLGNVDVYLARTGYTGEDGFEVFVWNASTDEPQNAEAVWKALLESGKTYQIEPCGLGARDTLRLEAGLCLYGNDIDETTTPLEAGLGFVVKLQKHDFIGKDSLQKRKTEGVTRKRIGLVMMEQGILRPGFEILDDRLLKIGQLTSGTFSPILKCGIGMGYVNPPEAQEGSFVGVKIRDKVAKAKITSFPLFDTEKYGYRRKTAV
jgi:aminomethyltransferase